MPALHGPMVYPGNKTMIMQAFPVINVGNHTASVGACLCLATPTATWTALSFPAAKMSTALLRRKMVAGVVADMPITPLGTGTVAMMGRGPVLVVGTVLVGDWLEPSSTHAGAAEAYAGATGKRTGFALALQTHSGVVGPIRALMVPWRI